MIKLADLLNEITSNEARLPGYYKYSDKKPPKLGKVYHNTSFEAMASIVKDGMVLKNLNDCVNFSRAKRFWKAGDVRIIVDGKRLAEKYDLEPRDWAGDSQEWEESICDSNEVDISDFILKVLLKPSETETTKEDWITDYMRRYTLNHNEAVKNWPKKKAHLKSVGYNAAEIRKYEKTGFYMQDPGEKEKQLRSQPNHQGDLTVRHFSDIVKGLEANGIPYEITDNFPANS